MITLKSESTEQLKGNIKGVVVLPIDASYDEVREIWNGMIELWKGAWPKQEAT